MRISNGAPPKGRLREFSRDRQGSVATIFAVALVPVIIAAGIGIDMSRAMSSRTNLQDALDATALALAHLPANTPQATLNAKAATWLAANLSDGNMSPPTITVALSKGQVVLDATSKVSTTLTAIAGYKEIPVAAHSMVKWGLSKVEVALVLDNTGSMLENNKLAKLKTAAAGLIDTLDSTTDKSVANALRISVVPFSMTVRVGTASEVATYSSANWLDPTAKALQSSGKDIFQKPLTDRLDVYSDLGKVWAGCVEARMPPYDIQDTAPNTAVPSTLFIPYFAPDEPDDMWGGYELYPNNYMDDRTSSSDWKVKQGNVDKYKPVAASGCTTKKSGAVTCSDPGYTPVVRSGTTSMGYQFGPNAGCSMTPLLRLTTNVSSVKAKLTAMQAVGETNIPLGLMWGWHTLSPNPPFADGTPYSTEDVEKIIVLLTDGDNTNMDLPNSDDSMYSGLGYIWQGRLGITTGTSAQRTTAMDARMTALCNNAKAAGITIFTVRIDVSGSSPEALRTCASSASQFYDIDSTDLSKAFDSIAGQIGKLRIAQ